jgi:hypothetical protein
MRILRCSRRRDSDGPRTRPLALAGLALFLMACSSGIPARTLEVDCSVNDDYEFLSLQPMEGATAPWFAFGDATPGGQSLVELRQIPEGPRCTSTTALVLTVRGHTDWGAGFGEYQTAMDLAGVDASDYEGISFWARATGFGTSSGFIFGINDRNSSESGNVCTVPVVDPTTPDSDYIYNQAGMAVPASGALPGPDDCGNGFSRVMTAHREWYLHRIPFSMFRQLAQPNREPTGIDASGIFQFTVNVPKDSNLELWIDDLGAYRDRPVDARAP